MRDNKCPKCNKGTVYFSYCEETTHSKTGEKIPARYIGWCDECETYYIETIDNPVKE